MQIYLFIVQCIDGKLLIFGGESCDFNNVAFNYTGDRQQ